MSLIEAVPDSDEEAPYVVTTQLVFDGMPVQRHKLRISGSVEVSEDAAASWTLGQQVTITVIGVVSSRAHSLETVQGEPTGSALHKLVLHVHDLEETPER